jgi:hypothetical protein
VRIRHAIAVATVLAVPLAAPAAASAHGSSAYVVTVRGVTPLLAGVHVRASRGSIVLANRSPLTVVVVGPNGLPYLRLDRSGVAANFGRAGRPRWAAVARGRTFAWPDVRTEIDSAAPPLVVRKEPGKSHHVRDWRIPLRAGGRSYAIVGSLDYRVTGEGLADFLFPFAPVPLLLLLAVGVVRRARRSM